MALATEVSVSIHIFPSTYRQRFSKSRQNPKLLPGSPHGCQTSQERHVLTPAHSLEQQHHWVLEPQGALYPHKCPLLPCQPDLTFTMQGGNREAGIIQGLHVRPEPIHMRAQGPRQGHTLQAPLYPSTFCVCCGCCSHGPDLCSQEWGTSAHSHAWPRL